LKKTERFFICGDAHPDKPPPESEITRLNVAGRHQNCNLKITDIHRARLVDMPDILLDLLEIAVYVFCADQSVSRGGQSIRDMGAKWRREFHFFIPVRQTDFWNREEVKTALTDTLWFLSEDEYQFQFSPLKYQYDIEQLYFEFSSEAGQENWPEEVMLFSGGLDSLGGAIQELILDQRNTALVSHRSTYKTDSRQNILLENLFQHCSEKKPFRVPVLVNKSSELTQENTQRTRSFLYASLAFTVARLYDLHRIRFYENGITSLNFPIAAQLTGAYASRTTHPRVLSDFSRLFSMISEKEFKVENRFIWKTKTDVINLIGDAKCEDLIRLSSSCSHTRDSTKMFTHCGTCSQCINRRFGALASRYGDYDPEEMYKVNLLMDEFEEGEQRILLESYIKSAKEVNDLDDLQPKFPEIGRVLNYLEGTADQVATEVYKLHKKHSSQVMKVLVTAAKENIHNILRGVLPSASAVVFTVTEKYLKGIDFSGTDEEPFFRKVGDLWIVGYNGLTVPLSNLKGLNYIAYLLSKPNQEISIYELNAEINKLPGDIDEMSVQALSENQLETILSEAKIPLTDPKTIARVKKNREEFIEELREAEKNHDFGGIELFTEQVRKIDNYLFSVTGSGGRIRTSSDSSERIRKSISITIWRTIDKIEKTHRSLGAHLRNSINTGVEVSYKPETDIHWHL